jgi:peptide/nickel transport system ATP-binding protein/oligopeptide transport system ATP-binding protein
MAEREPVLEVRDLSVVFRSRGRELLAVDRISLSLAGGEVLGLVGESGSGKTATALALMGLLPKPAAKLASGEIWFEGRDLARLNDRELDQLRGRRLAMIFQEPMSSLNPVQTIGRQIAEPLKLHFGINSREARKRSLELLDQVRVPAAVQRIDSYPHELSGGLRQRVMIAMAISCGPRVLIADEPTTALDVTVQAQIIDLLRDIQRDTQMSVIIVTHDLGVIADFAERVTVMYAGRIMETAPVGLFFDRPSHPYTEALIGSIPDPDQVSSRLVTIEGQVPKLDSMPPGCRFAPRCAYRRPACESVLPDLYDLADGSATACLRPFNYRVPTRADLPSRQRVPVQG